MPAWLSAILAWLKYIGPELLQLVKLAAAARGGMELQKGKDAQDALADLERSAKAAARVATLSDDDVLRELKERRLYRETSR